MKTKQIAMNMETKLEYLIFIDIWQAYDVIKWRKLEKKRIELGIEDKKVELIELTLGETNNEENWKENITINERNSQGDPMLSLLQKEVPSRDGNLRNSLIQEIIS